MNKKDAIQMYKEWEYKVSAYSLVLSTTYFDKNTIAPVKGSPYRNERLAYLSGELYSLQVDPKIIEVIDYLSTLDLNPDLKRAITLHKKSLDDLKKIPKDLYVAFDKACMDAFDAWIVAKGKKDYKLFENHLKTLIDYQKEIAALRNPERLAYDVFLDDYEEGMTMESYDKFFDLVKKELIPLIQKVKDKQSVIDDSFLNAYYPKGRQEKLMEDLKKHLKFDPSWGYMGVSEHPFTSGFSRNDVRITTAYDEHNLAKSIYSVVHEVGHAYYEHQIHPKYEGNIIGRSISSGMHESQSRLLENYIGRRLSFFEKFYPKIQKRFKKNLENITKEDFYKAVNASYPSYIRTEADELTYPIHILIRYEIEKGIFDGSISTEDLDKTWNAKYKEYLGLDFKDDDLGILQDVHWSGASFGYFPTYALGSAIAAQLMHTMEQEINVDEALSAGKIQVITNWLKKNVQQYAGRYTYEEILKMVTGESFNPEYYINYLKEKYTKLYEL